MKYNGYWQYKGSDYTLTSYSGRVQAIIRPIGNQILTNDEKLRYEAYRRLNDGEENTKDN